MRIARYEKKISETQSISPEQVGLHAQKIFVAARVVGQTFDFRRLLQQHCQRNRAHARAGWRSIRNVDRVDVLRLKIFGLLDRVREIVANRRDHLHDLDEFFCGQFPAKIGFGFQRNGSAALSLWERAARRSRAG